MPQEARRRARVGMSNLHGWDCLRWLPREEWHVLTGAGSGSRVRLGPKDSAGVNVLVVRSALGVKIRGPF